MASGNTMAIFSAMDAQPPATSYATLDTRNSHLVASFAASLSCWTYFEGILPRNYAGGGLTVYLWWMAASATSGTLQLAASIERHQAGTTDLDADDFAAEQTAAPTAPGTSGVLTATTIAFTSGSQMDSLAAGESFRLKVRRDGAGSDTMTGAMQLFKVEIKET